MVFFRRQFECFMYHMFYKYVSTVRDETYSNLHNQKKIPLLEAAHQ